jgi:hypothetical protein
MSTSSRPRRLLAAAAVAALAALAGCSSGGSGGQAAPTFSGPASATLSPPASPAAPPSSAGPANPVRLIVKAGAKPDKGARYGSTTAQGWLLASGAFPTGKLAAAETIDIYTLPAGLDGAAAVAQVGVTTDDTATVIIGPRWYGFVYPGQDANGNPVFSVSPGTVAARLGGQPVPGPS